MTRSTPQTRSRASLATVRLPWAPVILLSLASSGCADVLGLDGLSFDRTLEEDPAAPLTTDEPLVGTGGEANVDLSAPDDGFPLQVTRDVIVVGSPEPAVDSLFWLYARDAQTIASYHLDRVGKLGVQDLPSETKLSHLSAFPSEEGTLLFGFDSQTGFVSSFEDVDGEGNVTIVDEDVGTTGRTHMTAFPWGQSWLALAATASDGHYRYLNPNPKAGVDVVAGQWDPGLSSVMPYEFDGQTGVLRHDGESGRFQFHALEEYGKPLAFVFEVTVDVSATHVISSQDEGVPFVALYEQSSGTITTGSFGISEGDVQFFSWDSGSVREGLTSLVPVYLNGIPHAITYSDATGVIQLRSLSPLESSPVVVK